MNVGDYVTVIASGNTGKIISVTRNGKLRVRLASGGHKGQMREFAASSLTKASMKDYA